MITAHDLIWIDLTCDDIAQAHATASAQRQADLSSGLSDSSFRPKKGESAESTMADGTLGELAVHRFLEKEGIPHTWKGKEILTSARLAGWDILFPDGRQLEVKNQTVLQPLFDQDWVLFTEPISKKLPLPDFAIWTARHPKQPTVRILGWVPKEILAKYPATTENPNYNPQRPRGRRESLTRPARKVHKNDLLPPKELITLLRTGSEDANRPHLRVEPVAGKTEPGKTTHQKLLPSSEPGSGAGLDLHTHHLPSLLPAEEVRPTSPGHTPASPQKPLVSNPLSSVPRDPTITTCHTTPLGSTIYDRPPEQMEASGKPNCTPEDWTTSRFLLIHNLEKTLHRKQRLSPQSRSLYQAWLQDQNLENPFPPTHQPPPLPPPPPPQAQAPEAQKPPTRLQVIEKAKPQDCPF